MIFTNMSFGLISRSHLLQPRCAGRILNIVVTPTNKGDPPRLLNYLTSPHVLVWSAAVASSSLPGVFEANRLMVKDVDGTERYESAAEMKFSDGSMEQDLPMQQLSEMFNINHFIISQANPHAVMFGTYNTEKSVWIHPITGLFNSLLIFLKDQLRGWLTHAVELVGGRRFSPLYGTTRDFGTQILTQEYEGRACDISMVPWLTHRSLFSAFLHCIYNPSKKEFMEWIDEAEKETWKHIPAIKSHIAEEITLDRCVQRLRKRLTKEAWEKKRSNSYSQKMGERVPSFFTSPSLVNLGGLSVADQAVVKKSDDKNFATNLHDAGHEPLPVRRPPSTEFGVNHDSGLFIDEDDHQLSLRQQPSQSSGEKTHSSLRFMSEADGEGAGYFKTTSMAHFYYRKSSSQNQLHKSRSQEIMEGPSPTAGHERRKSKSQSDLATITKASGA